jgi:hypothetical protein
VAFIFGGFIALYQHYKIVATNLSGFWSGNWKQGLRCLKDLGFIGFALACYLYLLPILGCLFGTHLFPHFSCSFRLFFPSII